MADTKRDQKRKPKNLKRSSVKKRHRRGSAYEMERMYKKNQRSWLKRAICIFLAVVIIIVASGWGLFRHEVSAAAKNLSRQDNAYRTDKTNSDGVFNVLIVGTDKRNENKASRSDLIMVMTISTQTDEISITSFERDLYVTIPGYGKNKLNAAFAYGQEKLLMKTLKKNFGIKIDEYMTIDMYSIYKFIDACGGTRVTVKKNQIKYINMYIKHMNKLVPKEERVEKLSKSDTGEILLNGIQAISYARVRYDGDDFSRTKKQRMAILGVLKNWQYMLAHGQLIRLTQCYLAIPESCACIKTSMDEHTFKKMFSLSAICNYLSYDINQTCIPRKGTWKYDRSPSNASIVTFKTEDADGVNGLEKNKNYLKKHGVYGY